MSFSWHRRDLSGWHTYGSADWSVKDGAILGGWGDGYLITDKLYQDLEFTVYVRTTNYANGGIFFRWLGRPDRGFEIQIYSPPDGVYPSGSIYGKVHADLRQHLEEEWFLMQIILRGSHCISRIDGRTVAESNDISPVRAGSISLQMHRSRSTITFKQPRVRLLEPASTLTSN